MRRGHMHTNTHTQTQRGQTTQGKRQTGSEDVVLSSHAISSSLNLILVPKENHPLTGSCVHFVLFLNFLFPFQPIVFHLLSGWRQAPRRWAETAWTANTATAAATSSMFIFIIVVRGLNHFLQVFSSSPENEKCHSTKTHETWPYLVLIFLCLTCVARCCLCVHSHSSKRSGLWMRGSTRLAMGSEAAQR